ncbi:MAG: hypothetical protein WC375_04080 [Methanomassiliicoccales archaeon]|jgi:hypothetical protein
MEKRAWAKEFEIEGGRFEGTRRNDAVRWNACLSKAAHWVRDIIVRSTRT